MCARLRKGNAGGSSLHRSIRTISDPTNQGNPQIDTDRMPIQTGRDTHALLPAFDLTAAKLRPARARACPDLNLYGRDPLGFQTLAKAVQGQPPVKPRDVWPKWRSLESPRSPAR